MGHEAVGIVVDKGSDVDDYQVGDRVIILGGEGLDPGETISFFGAGDVLGADIGGLQGR